MSSQWAGSLPGGDLKVAVGTVDVDRVGSERVRDGVVVNVLLRARERLIRSGLVLGDHC